MKPIFQNRNLTLLWLGQTISQSGDSIYQIGLLWLVLELTGSESTTGLVTMAAYLPAVLMSLFAGVTADRRDRRQVMLLSDALRTLTVLMIPLLFITGHLTPLALGINAFILAIGATFFNPSRDAYIPQIVPQEGLLRANSLIQSSWQFSLLIGPFFAGILLHLAGNVHLFTLDALAYFLSFICIFMIRTPRQSTERKNSTPSLVEIKNGLRFALKHPVILPLLLITVADNMFIMGPALVGTPVLIKLELGLGAEAYAVVQGCYAVGMLTGTALLIAYGGRFNKGKILLLGMILDGITFVPVFFVRSLLDTAVVIVVHSLAIPLLTVSRASLVQALVPREMTGRIFAMINLAVLGTSALSAGITGIALEWWGVRWVFLVIGTGGMLCGIIGWSFAKELKETR